MEQLDEDMHPAMGQEWSFQLQQPNVIVSRLQEWGFANLSSPAKRLDSQDY
jgi:hypothetical protein